MQNLLRLDYEKILLLAAVNFRGDYQTTIKGMRNADVIETPPELYRYLEQEAQLAQSLLTSGLQEIANADFCDYSKGKFYGGAFQLSIGLERLFKLTVTLDHMLKNDFQAPTSKQLRSYGHNLVDLYQKQIELLDVECEDIFAPETWEFQTIEILSEFAKETRYYNLDRIHDASQNLDPRGPFVDYDSKDPLTKIVLHIARLYENQSREHVRQARLFKAWNTLTHSETNSYVRSPITGGLDMYVDVVQLENYVYYGKGHFNFNIIRYMRLACTLLESLVEKCHEYELSRGLTKTVVVPYLHHFFPLQFTSKQDALKRKRWG
ncbi:hypothetical protein DN730_16040 [Marinomonas piezotolerans]|uniref:Uncharacterized protein n=1 Tax=Marinomonas piezotolerans TaxID=2213058 RepID=A0A370U5G9_9GAMM|nr:hypothetical protein [Marinomonas piezotolerans]RDL43015.1 hypothetical protein DN730_16040 [Marinomonas piezotolerans]